MKFPYLNHRAVFTTLNKEEFDTTREGALYNSDQHKKRKAMESQRCGTGTGSIEKIKRSYRNMHRAALRVGDQVKVVGKSIEGEVVYIGHLGVRISAVDGLFNVDQLEKL